MAQSADRNDFLLELLALQQDGRRAISAPSNWTTQAPLLEVTTEVDGIIDRLREAILIGKGLNQSARWHFFIGSPGNGKSAAMGKLARDLLAGGACQIRDENDVAIQDLDASAIPYAVNVFEGSNKFASAQIVQDASVVRNPFSADVDPAAELTRTLEEAWSKGISLVVCTNRGVLEKAHRDNHTNQNVNSTAWFKVLAAVVAAETSLSGELPTPREFVGRKTVFKQVSVTYSHLDNRSLLLAADTFDKVLQKANTDVHWNSCHCCASRQMCPFRANRDWLTDEERRERVLQLLRRAEVYTGQVIVFREVLALVSFILAGCPKDYDGTHPCDWVRARIKSGDIFSLAARRIYMCLFASHCPYGLEADDSLRKRQLQAIRMLEAVVEDEGIEARTAVRQVVNAQPPSTDVGVTRILGKNGVLADLDPCREGLPVEFYERWDSDLEAVRQNGVSALGPIEQACLVTWRKLEEKLESAADHLVNEAHWALRRWASNYLLHLGALAEGLSAWAVELDSFAELLVLLNLPPGSRTMEQKKRVRDLDKGIEGLLDAAGSSEGQGGTVQLSDSVTLAGQWVRDTLKPSAVASGESGSVSLAIEFEGGERAVLAAPMYLWLKRRAAGRLDLRCFPQELLAGARDARIRAAAKGKYAFQDNDVEMNISTGSGEAFSIARLDGEVDVR